MEFYYKPFENLTVERYEAYMANREYWDDLGAEWKYSPVEKKLVRLAGLVNQGGSLKKAIDSYAEVHAHEYNRRIQYCVVRYILILMTNDQVNLYEDHSLVNRIKCLNKDELVELLTDELKRDMVPVYWKDANGQYQRGLDLLSKAQTVDDNNLDRIERHHWRTHPNEGAAYFRRAKKWWEWDLTLW